MKLKLKDLPKISGEEIDVAGILKDVVGYKKTWFFDKIGARSAVKKTKRLIQWANSLDLEKLTYNEDCEIKKPSNIDFIAFKAMRDILNIQKKADGTKMDQTISSVIASACYQKNVDEYYDDSCDKFKDFKQKILNQPLDDMFGLYNWVYNSVKESQKEWNKRFMSVEVPNEMMKKAGISRMNQFVDLTTIRKLCQDFNCSYDEAWQMSFALVQVNQYADATHAHIHENLKKLHEAKMEAERRIKRS